MEKGLDSPTTSPAPMAPVECWDSRFSHRGCGRWPCDRRSSDHRAGAALAPESGWCQSVRVSWRLGRRRLECWIRVDRWLAGAAGAGRPGLDVDRSNGEGLGLDHDIGRDGEPWFV